MRMESRWEGRKGDMGMWSCAQWQLKPGLNPSGLGLFCRAGFFSDVSTTLRLCFECQTFHSWPCSHQLLWVSTRSLGLRKLERSQYICPRHFRSCLCFQFNLFPDYDLGYVFLLLWPVSSSPIWGYFYSTYQVLDVRAMHTYFLLGLLCSC